MDTYAAASTVYHFFNTHKADGTPITLAGTPGIDIYKDNGTTQDADDSGLTLTVDFDSVTGLHLVTIDTSTDGTFYATGHVFNVVLSAGTVDSVSVVGTAVYQFRLGEVPADVAKISGDSTAADNLEDFYEETTAIGNLIDMFDGTGYAGGTIKLATDATLNANQGSYAPAKAGDAMTLTAAYDPAKTAAQAGNAMDLVADAIKKTTFDESTAFPLLSADTGATSIARTGADSDTLETLSDQIDGAALEATLTAIKGAGWSTETLAAIDALIDTVKAKTDLIPASPAAVGSAMTLTAAYDAAKTAAQASDIPTANITAILADTGEIQAELADGGRTDLLIDGIKAKTDNLPADPADDSDIDSQLATIAGYLDTEIAAILADTNELQTDLVNGGRLDLLIDGIKAKTDLIPASPAAVGSAMTLTAAYDLAKTAAQTSDITTAHATTDGKIDAVDNYVDTEISTIIATLATIQGYVDDLESRLTAARAGYLDLLNTNLDAAISTRAAASTALSTATWTNTKAGYIDAAISSVGGGSLTAADIADAVLDEAAAGHTGVIATNLDAAVSTRLATTGYTAPSNSDITTIKTAIENATYGLSALKTSLTTIQGYVDDLETRLTAARAGYLDNLSTAPPTASDIDTELSSTHGAGAWGAASTGSSTYPSSDDPFLDNSGNPVEGVSVECYSSSDYSAGSLVQVVETDINGLWEFHLNPGTYYFRAVEEGYDWAVDGGDNEWSDTVT